MARNKKYIRTFPGTFPIILMTFFVVCALSGCEPFRKKFIREKKKDEEKSEFVPVLEPIDYERQAFSPVEQYKKHYGLWKVWEKELKQAVSRGDASDKRQEYLLSKVIEQLEEMGPLVDDVKRQELESIIEQYRSLQKKFDEPSAVRNNTILRLKLDRYAKDIRNEFNPGTLEGHFKL